MLNVSAAAWRSGKPVSTLLGVFAFQESSGPAFLGLDASASRRLADIARADGFKGKAGDVVLIRPSGGRPAARVLCLGMGKRADFEPEALRRAAGLAVKKAAALAERGMAFRAPEVSGKTADRKNEFQALAEGVYLGSYRFDRYRSAAKKEKPLERVVVYAASPALAAPAAGRARIFAEAACLTRDLVNEPPSRMNPERMEREARKLSGGRVTVRVLQKPELIRRGMGGLLGVGAGSAVPPRLIELVYRPAGRVKKTVALVGKGITFDSGGLSIKSALNMETMKMDMAGAASILGIVQALKKLAIPVEVRGYLAVAENMPGGRAQKPGDILRTFSGKTVEVLNTDAEGRLVLADALAYAASKKPDVMIDMATLTGAVVVALGSLVSGVMGNRDALVDRLVQAGNAAGEKLWPLPLVKEYQGNIRSDVADVKNIGFPRGEAGSIIGGLFLQEFAGDGPWAHVDIAGPAWSNGAHATGPAGGTGHPVRTLLHYLESLS